MVYFLFKITTYLRTKIVFWTFEKSHKWINNEYRASLLLIGRFHTITKEGWGQLSTSGQFENGTSLTGLHFFIWLVPH